jgi:hypothetical protein
MKDEAENFLNTKEDVLNKLVILHFNLKKCVEIGMIDNDSDIYNNIDDIIDLVKAVDTKEELEEVITQAKTIERQIDIWLSSQGQTTISISWPTF